MLIVINFICMCASLYVAFGKPFRPISWRNFYLNLFAAGINLLAIIFSIVINWGA